MDPRHSAQDVVRCTLCKDAVAPMYCEVCLVHLCDECVEKHLFDTSNAHKVVPLTQFLSFNYPKCPDHPNKECDVTICKSWISPENHSANKAVDNFEDLESLFIESEEQGNIHPSHFPYRSMLDVPRLITDIPTKGYTHLYNVSYLSDTEIWTSGEDKTLKLYNLKGKLIKSIQTKSGNVPEDITVNKSGNLVYTDYDDHSINIVSDTQLSFTLFIKRSTPKITLREWRSRGLCSTSSGSVDLLVIMDSDDFEQTKVVRFVDYTDKQSIQWDDRGKPLYSSL